MELVETNDVEIYENFVKNSYKAHFMQSYYWGEVMKEKHFEPHYLLLKEKDNILASALLLKKKLIGKYCYFYIPRGYIIDYQNDDLIDKMTIKIKEYAKKNNAIFVKIDPDIKLHDLDLDGKVVSDNDNFNLIDHLNKLGYHHMGFYKSFTGEQPRYTFRLNLDRPWDEVYGGMHPTTRKILNKGNQYNLDIYIGNEKDIESFYETMIETAQRENIKALPIEYYKNYYNILKEHNMTDLYIAKVKIDDLKKTYKEKVDNIKLEIEKIKNNNYKNQKKQGNLLNDLNKKYEKANKEFKAINEIKKDEIILSSIMTAKYADKVWTIHGGNSTLLRELNSNYLLYLQIVKDAHNNKFKMIDFFGTSGIANPDKNDPIYGIHNFKKRLGGEYIEFIGEFDLITNRFMYFTYKKLIPIYRKLKK